MPYPIAAVRGKNFGSPTIPWYLSGGIAAANCLAAFQPKGAATYAASKVSLTGSNNATDGAAYPGFDTSYGWGFTAASSQYLAVGSGLAITSVPLTIAVLFQATNVTTSYALAGHKRSATSNAGWQMYCAGAATGDPIRINSVEASAQKTADSTAGYTADTWYTAISVFATSTSRSAYLNGTNKGSNTEASVPTMDTMNTYIGCTSNDADVRANYLNGKIAACAFYNTNLSDAQVLALHNAMAALVA